MLEIGNSIMAEGLYTLIPIAEKYPTTIEDAIQAINKAVPGANAHILDSDVISLQIRDNGIGWDALLNVSCSVYYWELFVFSNPYDIITENNDAKACRRSIKKIALILGSLECWYISETRYIDYIYESSKDDKIDLREIEKYSADLSHTLLLPKYEWEQPFIHDTITEKELEEWQ